jgi:hypothetical protein
MHISETEALVLLLEDWANWQSSYRPNTGFKSRSAGFSSLGLQSFDDMCHQSDNATMRALDSAIDDLDPAPRAAINRKYGVCSVFRFPRDNFEQTLIIAHDRLVVICKRKGIVL